MSFYLNYGKYIAEYIMKGVLISMHRLKRVVTTLSLVALLATITPAASYAAETDLLENQATTVVTVTEQQPVVQVSEAGENLEVAEKQEEPVISYDVCRYWHVKENKTPVYVSPSKANTNPSFFLDKNERIFVIGESSNGHHSVLYKDETFFIKSDALYAVTDDIFKDVGKVMFLNQETPIYRLASDDSLLVTESAKINSEITVTGESDKGFYRVEYKGKTGYIPKEVASELKAVSEVSEVQRRIAENARGNNGTFPCKSGYCAAWVTGIYHKTGLYTDKMYFDAINFWLNWGINDGITSSTRSDNIPVGAVVVGSGPSGENQFGHVGIYLGDGLVAENVGRHKITPLDEWIEHQNGECRGYKGYIGWVFPYNVDLTEFKSE